MLWQRKIFPERQLWQGPWYPDEDEDHEQNDQ